MSYLYNKENKNTFFHSSGTTLIRGRLHYHFLFLWAFTPAAAENVTNKFGFTQLRSLQKYLK